MPVFIILFKVEPDEGNPQVDEIAGAYVNCFLETKTFQLAKKTALKFLREEKWLLIKLEESWKVTEKDDKNDPKDLAF